MSKFWITCGIGRAPTAEEINQQHDAGRGWRFTGPDGVQYDAIGEASWQTAMLCALWGTETFTHWLSIDSNGVCCDWPGHE